MDTTESVCASMMLWERKKLQLSGIEDVISFDELSVYLVTENGNLLIEGTELHITTLDVASGNMIIEGAIRSMIYHDKETKKKDSFFTKILK